jgi:hypothetical protein
MMINLKSVFILPDSSVRTNERKEFRYQIKAPDTQNIVSNMSKAIHSPALLTCTGDICRVPITPTFMYAIRKIVLINENYKKLFLVFGERTKPDCFLNAGIQLFAVNFYDRL